MIIFNNSLQLSGELIYKPSYSSDSGELLLSIPLSVGELDDISNKLLSDKILSKIEYNGQIFYNYTKISSILADYVTEGEGEESVVTNNVIFRIQLRQDNISNSQYQSLINQIEELENCIIEMSELLYRDDSEEGVISE